MDKIIRISPQYDFDVEDDPADMRLDRKMITYSICNDVKT